MAFLLKSLMTCASVFVNGMTWLSVVYLICSFFLVYLYLTWLPYLHAAINHVRIAAMTSILYASLLLIIMSYAPGVDQNNPKEVADFNGILTNLLWAGLVPVTLAGAAMSYIHTRFWAVTVVNKFREAPSDAKLHRVYPFTDPRQVEIASRCCRQWLDEDTLDEEAGRLAERIILAGKKLMPHQPYMTIWYSSFLIDVQGSYQSGYTELQLAKKATNPTYLERFCMFIREQEHTQRASAVTSGENGSVDLVSYVEFQRNLRLAVRMHMDALLAMRNFWETLLHANITFDKLSRAVARIETCVRASERMYRTVLSRHSSSVKVLQLYVKFLQGVRNDPWSAARWAAEAEKLQKMEEEANERAVFGGDDTELGGMSRNDDTKGIIIMGANCLIRMINDAACELVGYQYKSELMGKNVFVTKVSGIGEDSVFMGVFQPIHIPPNTAVLWVLGYKQEDLTGKPITEMVQQPEELERLSAKTDHTNLQALVCGVSDVSFKHLYTDELLTVDAEVKIGGISETALWVITLKRAAPATSKLMVTDSRGRILHVTQALSDCLGTTPAKLQLSRKSHALDTLLPAPFTRLHHQELPGKEPMNVVAFQDSSFEQARDDDPLNDASAASALMDMANRSFSTPGLSWRVGVAPIMDPDKLAALGPIGMAMIARKTVPAIMTVEPHLDGGHMEGASVMLPAEMHLMVELWRADLLSGVLELDTQGNVVQLGVKEQPIYSPHLLLGYPASMLQGAAISALLPTVGKAHLETLFTEGSMGKALGKPGVGRPGKGGMAKGGFHRRRAVGPLHHVKLLHGTDGAELELQVQAVVKQDVGAGCALYLIVHLEQPRWG
ncbi:uncharacterized protein HaLaN_13777 [Haematococcus lacustris]|uniref:TmcB/TmcC TPR repeats domain-containing protein n=1 Tax=Haematococcus lacustris TaxID=44745 RepID=A0A699ZE09_HAELA|nr:uncharacterized protein HaLaN_13777 [Haematococcus lacustris]